MLTRNFDFALDRDYRVLPHGTGTNARLRASVAPLVSAKRSAVYAEVARELRKTWDSLRAVTASVAN